MGTGVMSLALLSFKKGKNYKAEWADETGLYQVKLISGAGPDGGIYTRFKSFPGTPCIELIDREVCISLDHVNYVTKEHAEILKSDIDKAFAFGEYVRDHIDNLVLGKNE